MIFAFTRNIILAFGLNFILLGMTLVKADETDILHRVYVVANIADVKKESQVFGELKNLLSNHTTPFTLLINGDLITELSDKKLSFDDSTKLRLLLSAVENEQSGQIIIIPGERDWADSGDDGWERVKKLEKHIESFGYSHVKWAVKNGCPGPKEIQLTEGLFLVALNTQWWNHPYEKPGPADADCKISTTDNFKEEIEDILNENSNSNILITGHYPLESLGKYGGHIPVKTHLFPLTEWDKSLYIPLPVLGSLYAGFRENVGTSRDISNHNYTEFRSMISNIINDHSSMIYVSGHEKNLQILRSENNYYINSGALTNPGTSKWDPHAVFCESAAGLIEIIYYTDGAVEAKVHTYLDEHFEESQSFDLYTSPCSSNGLNLNPNSAFIPCTQQQEPSETMFSNSLPDTHVIAGAEYHAGSMKRLFFGAHYRDDWTSKIKVPYLNLDTTFLGLKVLKKGGGRQTKSLKFMGGNGMRYVFRSVNKDPIKALDYELRETIAAAVVRDQTTTQHPYGALATDILLNQVNILHAHPRLYVLPDDKKLGIFQAEFGNMLGMLEESPRDPDKGVKGFAEADEIIRSHKLFRKLYEDHNNRVNGWEFAVARIFDILIGDWGKHEDNWKWAGFHEGKRTIYRPIPRDRDHVFSRWDGILPWIADREWAKESGEDFDFEITGLRSLMFQARHLDRFVASELSRQDWLEAATFVQEKISDDVIEEAIANMPAETYELSGRTIEAKLKRRVNDLQLYATKYYDMLAEQVDVIGSNKREYFEVIRNEDGSITVTVFDVALETESEKGTKSLYSRVFLPSETEEIRLYGLSGRDIFRISGDCEESILIRVIGGPGKDSIIEQSEVQSGGKHTLVYENSKKAKIELGNEGTMVHSNNYRLYNYDRTAFAYDTYFPLPYLFINSDDGFIFGLGVEFTTQAFGKRGFSSKHRIGGSVSTAGSIELNYALRIHEAIGTWDFALESVYTSPSEFTYFYGIGNETVKDDSMFRKDFYKTRYASRQVGIGFVKDFWKVSRFNLQLRYENNEAQIDEDKTIFGTTSFLGEDKINMVEGFISLDLDFRDNAYLPTSGMRLYLDHHNGIITSEGNANYGRTLATLEFYTHWQTLTFGIRAGAGDIYGELPFYRQFALGQDTYLRGYRNSRFTGQGMMFGNLEVHQHLFTIATSVVPINFGLKGFFDSGKIIENEKSDKWHNGYGFGFYLIPLRKQFTISITAGFSEEESGLIKISLGKIFD